MSLHHLVGTAIPDTSALPTLDVGTAETLAIKEADVHYCLLEIPVAQSIAMVPPGLHPSVPGLMAFLHYRCAESSLGAFDLVTTAVVCRSAAKHRMITVSAFINNERAAAFFEQGWGYKLKSAEIRLAIHYHRILTSVSLGGQAILEVATNDPIPLSGPGATVRYAQTLNLAQTPAGIKYAQVDVSYDYKQVARGVPKILTYQGAALGDPNPAPRHPVSGTIARAGVSFDPVRFLADPLQTAETGGITMLPRAKTETA